MTEEAITCRRCSVCEGLNHHWLPDDGEEPRMVCKHCEATCAYFDDDDVEELAERMCRAMAKACNWPNDGEWDKLVPALRAPYLAMATVALEMRDFQESTDSDEEALG